MQPEKPTLETPLWEYVLSVWSRTSFHGWSLQFERQFAMRPALLAALAFAGHHQRCVDIADVRMLMQVGEEFYRSYHNKLKVLQQKIAHYQELGEEVWKTWNDVMEKTLIQAMQVELAQLHDKLWKCPMSFADESTAIRQNWHAYVHQLALGNEQCLEATTLLNRLASELLEASRLRSDAVDQALS